MWKWGSTKGGLSSQPAASMSSLPAGAVWPGTGARPGRRCGPAAPGHRCRCGRRAGWRCGSAWAVVGWGLQCRPALGVPGPSWCRGAGTVASGQHCPAIAIPGRCGLKAVVGLLAFTPCQGVAGALQRAGSRPGGRPTFCRARKLDQEALSKLRVESGAPVETQALRLACPARTQPPLATAVASAVVPLSRLLGSTDPRMPRSRLVEVCATQP
jgi:hypothetical protein